MNGISIIIPFVNEQEEVILTIDSIIKHSNDISYEIIVINDASDDNYNYKEQLKDKDNVIYYENYQRLGVAECRNMGVLLSNFDIFLLLDAHMRFFNSVTLSRFMEVLYTEPNAILCCHTSDINSHSQEITPFGAYIEFLGEKGLTPIWNTKDLDPSSMVVPTPCILGAAYAVHKKYWFYLKGLTGLQSYGSDEAYLSLKTWLSGGKCLIIKDIVVGHLYREIPPYPVMGIDFVYNKILVALLILPNDLALDVLSNLKNISGKSYSHAMLSVYNNLTEFIFLKEYYNKIFQISFKNFYEFNHECMLFTQRINKSEEINQEEFIKELISQLNNNEINDYGLYHGKMGIAIILYLHNRNKNDPEVDLHAGKCLDDVIFYIQRRKTIDLSYGKGLLGIAWGISFLINQNFVDGNINEILNHVDNIIFNNFIFNDWNFDTGILGMTYYAVFRLKDDSTLINKYNIFFLLLTQSLKMRFTNNYHLISELGFPLITLLYLGIIEKKMWLVDDVLSINALLKFSEMTVKYNLKSNIFYIYNTKTR